MPPKSAKGPRGRLSKQLPSERRMNNQTKGSKGIVIRAILKRQTQLFTRPAAQAALAMLKAELGLTQTKPKPKPIPTSKSAVEMSRAVPKTDPAINPNPDTDDRRSPTRSSAFVKQLRANTPAKAKKLREDSRCRRQEALAVAAEAASGEEIADDLIDATVRFLPKRAKAKYGKRLSPAARGKISRMFRAEGKRIMSALEL
ncbi:hypothetical protein CSUB01_04094 [Colletotrichum sublineola]|uniref:Uncharacterized protein n=1 Tax=Colletotrichum sublineola TaxID=1173701 RepID=A0A066X4Q3_COLSU|nr:hypothetical protein CSUB01_04094 [Colletotrichum sublineola]